MSFSLTLTIPAITNGQIPLFNTSSDNQGEFTPWWKLGETRVCGKLWCSHVNFPYFPYEVLNPQFTIASRADLENPQATVNQLEIRTSLVEQTLLSLYQKIVRNSDNISEQDWQNQIQKLEIKPQHWLLFAKKPLHPLTPRIERGIKNDQTVIFVPAQPTLGLSQETIITVTEDDSIHNGKPIDELAEQWRNIIRQDLSDALWGYEFDRLWPWARLGLIGVIFVLTIVLIILMTIVSNLIRNLDLQLKAKLKKLEELAKLEQQAAFYYQPESSKIPSDNPEKERQLIAHIQGNIKTEQIANTSNKANQLAVKSLPLKKLNLMVHKIQQLILTKIPDLTKNLSTISLAYQNLIKQLKNFTEFSRQFLLWLRFLLLFFGLALIVSVYPITRSASFFFIFQAIFLPLIWMSVSLGNTLTSFVIDYYLNRWAKEAQIAEPNSNRYALRVTTYSPALKGASSFLFIILGIYLTIQLLGIDPAILAGAGGAALLIGFLARNVLEDMLNGVLILWTDRYAVGDIITVGTIGGFVENMNLYITQIRGAEGSLITIPNGQISLVQNKTKDWSRVEFKIEISTNSDPLKAIKILQEVGEELQQDPDWQELILEPVNILGIDQVSHQGILLQVWIKTQPMKQWAVGREYRLRIQQRFKTEGIELGIPQRQIWHRDKGVTGS